jgi:membrane protein
MKRSLSAGKLFDLVKETWREWSDDDASRCAAAVAYYTTVSIAPLLVILLALVAAFWGEEAAAGHLKQYFAETVGQGNAAFFEEIIAHAQHPQVASWAGAISLGVLAWGASNVFAQLQCALNTIWDAPDADKIQFRAKIYKRLASVGMVLTLGFLLLVSLALSTLLAALGTYFPPQASIAGLTLGTLHAVLSFVLTAALIATIYKVLPDVKIGWRHVIFGAVLTTALFTIGKIALGWYLGRASTSSAYGAAGSLVVFLLWVNYSAQIFFFGAEFTQVYARRFAPEDPQQSDVGTPE